jgi:hypothetical protein
MDQEAPDTLQLQVKVSKILSVGFVFSLVWVAGIGSLAAFALGLYARNLINRSNGKVGGIRMAWWCIVVGAIGMITMPIILLRR